MESGEMTLQNLTDTLEFSIKEFNLNWPKEIKKKNK